MNIPTLIILLLIFCAAWFALRTLKKNDGHPCSGCRGGGDCPYCKR